MLFLSTKSIIYPRADRNPPNIVTVTNEKFPIVVKTVAFKF